jgi:hypothetical protein
MFELPSYFTAPDNIRRSFFFAQVIIRGDTHNLAPLYKPYKQEGSRRIALPFNSRRLMVDKVCMTKSIVVLK